IRHYLAGEPIEAKADSSWYVLRKTIHRYRLAAAIAAAFVLLVSVSTIILAVLYRNQGRLLSQVQEQKKVALDAETRAERRFDQVQDLAHAFIDGIEPRIKHLVGSTSAREYVVSKGLEYLDSLTRESEGHLELQWELGSAYFKIGEIQGGPQGANLGDREGALDSHRKGLALIKAIAETKPNDHNLQYQLGTAYQRVAVLQDVMGLRAEAAEHYQEAQRIAERLAQADPDNRAHQRQLTVSYDMIAYRHLQAGRLDEALATYRKSLYIARTLADAEPDSDISQRDLAVSHDKIGRVLFAQGKVEDALNNYQKFLQIIRTLADADPQNAVYQRDLGVAHEHIGVVQKDLGRHEHALASFNKTLSIRRALSDADPENADSLRLVTSTYCVVGEAQLALDRPEAALSSFQDYMLSAEKIAKADPADDAARREFGVSFYKMAELEAALAMDESRSDAQRRQHWTAARSWFQKCHAVFVDMRDRGILRQSDAAVPDEIAAEIATCDAMLANANGAASNPKSP
ncbi:MAG: tetratricopeptide repeat protein, partial [Planctomycetota bacterium]|nr:tetratricopeptide repeat protein [Planctomycetota bacterium]